ncbi:hypothetical protein LTS18_011245, partial [Coniosporium uncinatum]
MKASSNLLFLSLASYVVALPPGGSRAALSSCNSKTSLTLLYQNNLNFTDDKNHISFILLDPLDHVEGSAACASISENLLSATAIRAHSSDVQSQLSYLAYAGRAKSTQQYYIQDGIVEVTGGPRFQPVLKGVQNSHRKLPVLCTQSSTGNSPSNSVATASNQMVVQSNSNSFVGFRNQKSFRFQGIPFADKPNRFEHSHVYTGRDQVIDATKYGPDCSQPYDSNTSEDCLFINIQTQYIPQAGRKNDLRPVHFWIYGGGFTGGSGASAGSDGGQLASREDIVVVEINYRLTTLGFLAIPGTNITGNYGISDQVTGLEWTIQNIAAF